MTTVPKYPFDLDRAAIYRELARVVAEDQPFTMMWNYSEIRAFSKRLRGVEFAPSGVFLFQPTPPHRQRLVDQPRLVDPPRGRGFG